MDPIDKLDALDWAVSRLAGDADGPLDKLRLHLLKQLRDEARREARK